MIRELFEKISGANDPVRLGENLRNAAAQGDLPRVQRYLRMGAQVDAADSAGLTALYAAAARGHASVVQCLIEAKADLNAGKPADREGTPLTQAVAAGHADVAMMLARAGADLSLTGYEWRTPLHEAIWRGYPDLADKLLDIGSPVNTVNREGNSVLNEALNKGEELLAIKLVRAGADWTAKDRWGAPAEDRAVAQQLKDLRAAIEDEKSRPAREAEAARLAAEAFVQEIAQAAVLQNDTAVLPVLQVRRRPAVTI